MQNDVIVVEGLSVDRGGRRVLNEVSFAVERGEVFALLGGNGAGKSTTLLTLLGLLSPAAGDARVLGHSAAREAEAVRERVAYLPEMAALYGHLSARENLAYFLQLCGRMPRAEQIEAGLEQVGLQASARGLPLDRYSKGMRQKVAIALALLRETPVLLLDEPTSGLDPLAIDEFNELVAGLSRRDITVLMVTHDVYGACQVAHRIGVLREGRIIGVFDGGTDGRIDPESVHRAFTGKAAA